MIESDVNKLIAKQLLKLRQFKQLSQTELGAVIDVSNQQISKIESGKNKISASQLFLISLHYKIEISKFYRDDEFI